MPETIAEGARPVEVVSPVCIHTAQIIDSCLDKDCVENLRVYLTAPSQAALDGATGAKTRCAELLYTDVEIAPLAYKCGYYSIDLTFYYRIVGDALQGCGRPCTITGIAVFSKRVVLYGSKGRAKTFRSTDSVPSGEDLLACNMPLAVVEALDPIILSSRVREVCDCHCAENEVTDIPACVAAFLGEQLVLTGAQKRLYVTLGQFSTVRLERDTQLSVQACEYCTPCRECCDEECCEEDPCELFGKIEFPMRAFFPESAGGSACCPEDGIGGCKCNCNG